MEDYKALSKKRFDRQAADYDLRNTAHYSLNEKTCGRDIAEWIERMMAGAGFPITDSRQITDTVYTVTGKKQTRGEGMQA